MNDSNILGNLLGVGIGLLAIFQILLPVIIIVIYFRIANRLEKISDNTKNASSILSEIKTNQSAQYKQYYFDHCFMSNLGPHEWFPTGIQTMDHWEFRCKKCGQIINVPKQLDSNPHENEQPLNVRDVH